MRLLYALVAVACTAFAAWAEPTKFTIENKVPSFKIENKAATLKKTICSCGTTRNCTCWADQCDCSACGLGVADPKVKKFNPAGITQAIPALTVGGLHQQVQEPGLSEGTQTVVTSTSVPPVRMNLGRRFGGGTNCPTSG